MTGGRLVNKVNIRNGINPVTSSEHEREQKSDRRETILATAKVLFMEAVGEGFSMGLLSPQALLKAHSICTSAPRKSRCHCTARV